MILKTDYFSQSYWYITTVV